MPIINPLPLDTSKVLAIAGRETRKARASGNLQEILDNNGLGPDDVIDALATIMRCGETEASRLKAAEVALKLNGLLQANEISNVPVVNIIINGASTNIPNPILIPRNLINVEPSII